MRERTGLLVGRVLQERDALGLFRSVIQSGEPWTLACQEAYHAAQIGVNNLVASSSSAGAPGEGTDHEDALWRAYRAGFLDGISSPDDLERGGYERWCARAEAGASAYIAARTIEARLTPPEDRPDVE